MIIAYVDDNQCDFAVKFRDKNRAIEVKKAITIGIDAWYSAANEEVEANEYWSKEYIEGFYDSGYAEPTSELLDMWGIEHEIVDIEDVECDEDGNIICDELV